ncbi:helix-turn-helix domain-containing protein [Terrilactibacillus sp. BCM23-1]|uniref:Helix-turn-helix domain-containing protein n=1 Tax=Terrilactibacillus tamarindi TaxID=2599694 RepID=A0A6N8CNH0_9BACI|nr:helix-turn-helix transcriptional regulator [Terrilactibacillus tamarindi]MTT30653.1 helix-turn-helix domain-containing protein [Terrilactibacillus tamarindi]
MRDILGFRIRNLRETAGYSQKELAEKLNISNVQLSRYESNNRKPDPDTLMLIADYFQVSTDYLLGRTDQVHEFNSTYSSEQDIKLINRIRQFPNLEQFIKDLLDHPDKMKKLQEIWKIIRTD